MPAKWNYAHFEIGDMSNLHCQSTQHQLSQKDWITFHGYKNRKRILVTLLIDSCSYLPKLQRRKGLQQKHSLGYSFTDFKIYLPQPTLLVWNISENLCLKMYRWELFQKIFLKRSISIFSPSVSFQTATNF